MITFNEYFDEEIENNKNRLQRINDLFKRVSGFNTIAFLERENPYIFVNMNIDSEAFQKLKFLKLGVRIFIIGGHLVYRLQRGPKGIIVGPSQKIEDEKEIESLIQKGKDEEGAYNEVLKKLPNEIRKYLYRVHENIFNVAKSKKTMTDDEMDSDKYKKILGSLVTANYDGSFKM